MKKTLLKGGTVVTGSSVRKADILIEGERIAKVMPVTSFDPEKDVCGCPKRGPECGSKCVSDKVSYPDAEVVDCTGKLLFPGFIDTHTHFQMQAKECVTADDFDSMIREIFCVDESEAVTAQAVQTAWAANRERLHEEMISSFSTDSYPQQTTTTTLTLSLDSSGGFDSLVLRGTTTYYERDWDYSTHSYAGDPRPRTYENTVEIAYEGRDLIVKSDDTAVGKITAEKEGELVFYNVDGVSQTEAARLQLTRNEAYWALTVLDGSGKTVATAKTGRQSASVQPLSAYESAMQKIDLAYLRELVNQAAPAAAPFEAATELAEEAIESVTEAVDAVETWP